MKIIILNNIEQNLSTQELTFDGAQPLNKLSLYQALKKHNIRLKNEFYPSTIDLNGETACLVFINELDALSKDTSIMDLDKSIQDEILNYKSYLKAIEFAKEKHGNQTYSFMKLPYFYHLKQTDKVIDYFFADLPANQTMTLKISALLHDVLEDTPVTEDELNELFGADVTDAVKRVTKVDEADTTEYEDQYYTDIGKNPLAVITKIADKCANTKQTVKAYSDWHAKRIIDGHNLFKERTYNQIDTPALKNYMDNLVKKLEIMHG